MRYRLQRPTSIKPVSFSHRPRRSQREYDQECHVLGHREQMSALRFLIGLFIFSSLSVSALQAQAGRTPVPVAEGTPFDFAIGYSFVNTNVAGKPSTNLNGVEASATIDFHPQWGAILDSSYVRGGRDPGSGHSSYVLSVLAGPVFVPAQINKNKFLVRGLFGISLVDSSVQINQQDLYYRGWESRFSWGIGTGIERNLSKTPFGVRVNVDYLQTRFIGSAATIQPQNGIRASASMVFRFGARAP